jgi:hypothetical protein
VTSLPKAKLNGKVSARGGVRAPPSRIPALEILASRTAAWKKIYFLLQ